MNGLEALFDTVEGAVRGFPEGAVRAVLLAVLAVVFLWSGATKLRRPWVAAMAMVDFGVLRRPVPAAGSALAFVELALGVALVAAIAGGSVVAAAAPAAAAVLLAAFVLLMARSLRAGRAFSCACFGNTEETISWTGLARTAGLAVVAVLLVATAGAAPAREAVEAVAAFAAGTALVGSVVLLVKVGPFLRLPEPPEVLS